MSRPAWLLMACAALAAGCFSPAYESGHLACADRGLKCPEGFHCALDNRCWRDGEDPSPDMAPLDLSQPDLAPLPVPPTVFFIASGGSPLSPSLQVNVSTGDLCIAGAATAQSGSSVTFGYFSTDREDTR